MAADYDQKVMFFSGVLLLLNLMNQVPGLHRGTFFTLFFYFVASSAAPQMPCHCIGGCWDRTRGLQRDVVYLCWPIAPSYMSPNAGGWGGEMRGLSQWVKQCTSRDIGDLPPYLTYGTNLGLLRLWHCQSGAACNHSAKDFIQTRLDLIHKLIYLIQVYNRQANTKNKQIDKLVVKGLMKNCTF
jgi:hypothetical protein